MKIWRRTPEGVRRMQHYWIATAMFAIGAIFSGVAAWYGQRFAVVTLVLFQIAIAVLLHFQRNFTWELLDHMREMNEEYARELEFTKALTGDHLELLGHLYEHDPTAAEVYQDRFSEAVQARWPQFVEERAKHAGMN